MGYWRGGGLYMSNGYLTMQSSTVVDNAVYGVARTDDLDKPNLASGVTRSNTIVSAGVNQNDPAVLAYEPAGNALDLVQASGYSVSETIADYTLAPNGDDDFLAILLDRLERHYNLTNFADSLTTAFEIFLQNVDLDDKTAGNQPKTDPDGNPVLSLADTRWFGPAVTWPKELANYPYIHFWHRLDSGLLAEQIAGMGSEVLGEDAYAALFLPGPLSENGDIRMTMQTSPVFYVQLEPVDQHGTARPA